MAHPAPVWQRLQNADRIRRARMAQRAAKAGLTQEEFEAAGATW